MRDEIQNVLSNNDGALTLESLPFLSKLDSLMKESLRLRPGTMGQFYTETLFTLGLKEWRRSITIIKRRKNCELTRNLYSCYGKESIANNHLVRWSHNTQRRHRRYTPIRCES